MLEMNSYQRLQWMLPRGAIVVLDFRERFKSCLNATNSGQSYKAFKIVINESRVVNMSNLLVTATLESSVNCL